MCAATKEPPIEMTEDTPRPIDKLKAVYLSVFIDVLGIGLGQCLRGVRVC